MTGIITVLVGMLLPVVNVARQAAMSTQCQSNLRQLVTASINYTTDNHGLWPLACDDILTTNLHRWHGYRATDSDPFDFATSPLRPYLTTARIKACPVFEFVPGGFEDSAGGYGYNAAYLGSSTGDLGFTLHACQTPANIATIRRPSEKLAFGDAAMAYFPAPIEYSFLEPPTTIYGEQSPSMNFRHRGRANVGWADGHVTSELFGWTYLYANAYGADNRQANLGWFGPKDNTLFQR